jgi:hypothetical protein
VYSFSHVVGAEFTFEDGETSASGLGFMETFRNDVTFTANGKSLVFVERGHNVARFRDDGTVTFTISGREFGNSIIGRRVLTFDPQTGQLLSVESVGQSLNLGDFCAALAP